MASHLIPDHVFRGYDLRGIAGTDLTEENVAQLGKAYATWLIQRRIPDCVVGHDCRVTGEAYSKAFIDGLTSSGINVYDIGLTLTQIAYFAQYYFRTRGMVMITASHNPKEYNGFKFGTGYSETMLSEDVIAFRNLYKSEKYLTTGSEGRSTTHSITEQYMDDVLRHVPLSKSFKVVVDSCSATTGIFLPDLLRKAGCTVIEQNTEPDGNFPVGTPDPTEKHVLDRLAKRVLLEGADLGFAYDADGDRMGVVDGAGNLIWNDVLCALYAKDILHHLPGSKIVFNTLCSQMVRQTIENNGGTPIIWKTGHSFIKEKVRLEGAPFGGELSGHFYFLDNFYGHDDGAIASLRLLSFLAENNISLEEAVKNLPSYISSPEIKVSCPDAIKFTVVSDELASQVKAHHPSAQFTEIDGIRMDADTDMLVIRASQNGPYLTVKFESKTQEGYEALRKEVSDILHGHSAISFDDGVNVESLLS